MSYNNLHDALSAQKTFSDLFFDAASMTSKQKEEQTKTFALCMHSIVSDLASSVNYKSHIKSEHNVDHAKILYKSVDIFRYTLALMNLWHINPDDFVDACNLKDNFLHMRDKLDNQKWCGQPTVIFDCDDVISSFKNHFEEWLRLNKNVHIDPNSTEYYCSSDVKSAGFDPETVFREYVDSHMLRDLNCNTNVVAAMHKLHNMGYWIQIVTARPADNLNCLYDTYWWLNKNDIVFNGVAFTPEKYRWLMDQDFYKQNKLVCVIDDSSKHAAEFAKHGVSVIVPQMIYNHDVANLDNILRLDFKNLSSDAIIAHITNF